MSARLNTLPLSTRFWQLVRKGPNPDACWEWTGGTQKGLPRFHPSVYVHESARRFSLSLAGVDTPRNKQVRPTCGNRLCVRPEHLRVGHGPNTIAKSPPGAAVQRKKPGPPPNHDRTLPKSAELARVVILETPPVCVCGAGRLEHGGKGARGPCKRTGCPAWFRRGA